VLMKVVATVLTIYGIETDGKGYANHYL